MEKDIRNKTADLRENAETEMRRRNAAALLGEPVATGNVLPPSKEQAIIEVFPDGSIEQIGIITE